MCCENVPPRVLLLQYLPDQLCSCRTWDGTTGRHTLKERILLRSHSDGKDDGLERLLAHVMQLTQNNELSHEGSRKLGEYTSWTR